VNFLDLAKRLRQECRVSGSGPSAVTGQVAEYQRLLDWTAEAWREIQRGHPAWRFMRRSCVCPTVNGQALYPAASWMDTALLATIGSTWSRWALDYQAGDTFRCYANPAFTFDVANSKLQLAGHGLRDGDIIWAGTTGSLATGMTAAQPYYVVNATADDWQIAATAGGPAITLSGSASGTQTLSSSNTTTFIGLRSETPLDVWDYDDLRDTYQIGATRSTYSRPTVVALAPNGSLAVGPVAALGYTLLGDFYTKPVLLASATDTPAMPEEYHMAIVYKAMTYYGVSEAAPEIYDFGSSQFDRLYLQLLRDQAPRVRLAGSLC
jgi:hypothetical protein